MTKDHPLTYIRANHAKLEEFAANHPELFTNDNIAYISCQTYYLGVEIQMRDAALVGDVLGKNGWTRKAAGTTYDWNRTINDVKLTLCGVEDIPGNGTTVPPSSFPLQLTNS